MGTFAGALAGGVLGTEVGKRAGKAMIDGASTFVDTLRGSPVERTATEPER